MSKGRLDHILQDQSKIGGSPPPTDQHRHHRPDNKTSDSDQEFVKEHISSFPSIKGTIFNVGRHPVGE